MSQSELEPFWNQWPWLSKPNRFEVHHPFWSNYFGGWDKKRAKTSRAAALPPANPPPGAGSKTDGCPVRRELEELAREEEVRLQKEHEEEELEEEERAAWLYGSFLGKGFWGIFFFGIFQDFWGWPGISWDFFGFGWLLGGSRRPSGSLALLLF